MTNEPHDEQVLDSNPTSDDMALKRAISFGFEVEDFIRSDIGRYLTRRADTECAELVEQLIAVDPTDVKTIIKLQSRIGVLTFWQQGLSDAVTEGIVAQSKFIEQAG